MAASKMTNSHRVSSATLSRPLRVLLAGLGAFGKEHLSRLSERSDVKVVGVADTNPAVLEPIRARLGVAECLTDPLRLIDVVEADAIIVATPAVSHIEISVRALSRNLSVLLEKPVAPSASSAVPLLAAAHSATGFIMPGHVLRFLQDQLRMAAGDDPLRNEHDHFLACVRDRSQAPALTLSQALIGLKLADAAIESLRSS
jgi:predicted dehydrogenase